MGDDLFRRAEDAEVTGVRAAAAAQGDQGSSGVIPYGTGESDVALWE